MLSGAKILSNAGAIGVSSDDLATCMWIARPNIGKRKGPTCILYVAGATQSVDSQ